MIPIVKPYLPAIEKYQQYIEGIFERDWLTNKGPLHTELESRLADYLGVEHFMLVSNGTVALQIAYQALGVTCGSAITTPFTFAATPASLKWQNIKPTFSDIDKHSLNLNPDDISQQQLEQSSAIVPVHVFGNPCEVEKIEKLAAQYDLKVIYDAAHCFGSQYKGQSVLNYGDAATISFHATKLFHCVEGGAIVFKEKQSLEKAKQLINFGFDVNNDPIHVGINAKMSEVHAAMGLAVLDNIESILDWRKDVFAYYQTQLKDVVEFQQWHSDGINNGAYAPILLDNEKTLLNVMDKLTEHGIQSRRYFYPNLANVLAYGSLTQTAIAEDISTRVLCLPMYYGLTTFEMDHVISTIKLAL